MTGANSERIALLALLAVLALAAFLRFFMLSEIGIRGDDTIYYLSLARGWAEPVREDYRWVIRGLYAFALHVWDSDWSVKALNAGLDVLSVLLLYGIARRLSGRVVSLVTALSYAAMPRAIAFSRTEALHTASTAFLLGSVAFLVAYLTAAPGRRRPWLLVPSGVLLGACYGIHEDVLLYAPGLVLCVLLSHLSVPAAGGRGVGFDARAALTHAAIATGSLLATVSLLGFWKVFAELLPRLARAPVRVAPPDVSVGVSHPELFLSMLEFNTSLPVAFLWFATTLVAVLLGVRTVWLRRQGLDAAARPMTPDYAPVILVVSYLVLYPYASPTHVMPRLFLPALPLVMLSVFLWIDRALALVPGPAAPRTALTGVGALALIAVNFTGYQTGVVMFAKISPERQPLYRFYNPIVIPEDPKDSFDASSYPISPYRAVFDFMKDRVGPESRLLVAPHAISSAGGERRGFRHYFRDDAVYIEDCVDDLRSFVEGRAVRYVVIANFHLKPPERDPECLELGDEPYSAQRDVELLSGFLSSVYPGTAVLVQTPGVVILELPDRVP